MVGGNDGAVVVLQVLVDDTSAFPDAKSTEAVARTFSAAARFNGDDVSDDVFIGRILKYFLKKLSKSSLWPFPVFSILSSGLDLNCKSLE